MTYEAIGTTVHDDINATFEGEKDPNYHFIVILVIVRI